MHEYGIAEEVARAIIRYSEEHGGAHPRTAWVGLGALSGLDPESLEEAYPIAAKGTAVEDVRLVVRIERAECRCRGCGATLALEGPVDLLLCEQCGSADFECPPHARGTWLTRVELEEGPTNR